MKDHPRQSFRWQPHTGGITNVKPKDFQEAGVVEAPHAYAAWFALKGTDEPLDVGDVIESDGGDLRIYKYVGFEEARWVLPEVNPAVEGVPGAAEPLEQAVEPGKT